MLSNTPIIPKTHLLHPADDKQPRINYRLNSSAIKERGAKTY